ncbi:hypothetical protein PR202_gb08678 [Eleusine coracana subsp. coracana]|uniref:Beta-fructofuranosidase n=1 Tax=Eleusine coracana subsp. coracana TaxID=191504 RepID=A0AAV5EF80_ELECO|nr:hypothetical protein PR202_gb08678 [Eleusine coracana subsp. coracana]
MGALLRVLAPWAVLLLALQLVSASHVIHRSLEDDAAPPSVPPSIVSPLLRTGYHFQPPKNWINAPMYYKGWYHLFYQYNPKGAVWGNIVWAHSVSRDLVNWIPLEPAIRRNIAFPKNKSDPLLRWVPGALGKPAADNPIAVPDAGINRDPVPRPDHGLVRRRPLEHARRQRAVRPRHGARVPEPGLQAGVKAKHPHSALTGMWECPDFFPLAGTGQQNGLDTSEPGAKYVLKNSLDRNRYDYYTIGKYDKSTDRYVPDDPNGDQHRLRYDYGNFYASKTFYDPVNRRRILWGWANESDSVTDDRAKGWAGIQAIPRKIWLDPSGKQLLQWPIEEIEKLRGKPVSVSGKVVKPGQHFEVTGLGAYQADVEVSFEVSSLAKAEPFDPAYANDAQKLCSVKGADVKGGVGPFGLWVLASANLQEKTAVFFRVFKDGNSKPKVLMCSDPTKSSLTPDLYKPTFAGFVDTDISSGKISLRSLIDRSVVESFGAGGRTCILSRVYPSIAIGKDAHLYVFNNGETDIEVSHLTAWEMKKPLMNEGA